MQRILEGFVVWIFCLGTSAGAHPHVFVDARTGFIFDAAGALEALKISWTYDQFTTLVLFESLDLDRDGDGMLSAQDRARIVEGETTWHEDYKGDVYLDLAGIDYPLGRPQDGAAGLSDDMITVSFVLPLSKPVDISAKQAVLRLYDPFFYYAYTILSDSETAGLPASCAAQVVPFEPDEAAAALQEKLAALSREDTPDQPNVGRLFADEVVLTCG